jgi:uncharacterized protein DUF1844
MAENKDLSYKVTDRRKFNPDGTPRDTFDDFPGLASDVDEASKLEVGAEEDQQAFSSSAATNVVSFPGGSGPPNEPPERRSREVGKVESPRQSEESSAAERAYQDTNSGKASRLPEASFFSLVNILAVEAAMHLGLLESPEGRTPVDLEAARHMIDMLGLLEEKTRGNLVPDEARMLETVLADLRVQFVALSRGR